jgi:hypothetical protein
MAGIFKKHEDSIPRGIVGPEDLSRREFLQRIGRYSAIAAVALAATPVLQSCDLFEFSNKNGTTPDDPIDIEYGKTYSVKLNSSKRPNMYFLFAPGSMEYFLLTISSEGSANGTLSCTLLDENQTDLGSIDIQTGNIYQINNCTATKYFLRFTSGGDATFAFRFDENPDYSDYADWNDWTNWTDYSDYSDWTNWTDYSDWTNWTDYNDYSDYSDYSCFGCSCTCQMYGVYY